MPADLLDEDVARRASSPASSRRVGPPTILVNAAGGMAGVIAAEDETAEGIGRTLGLNLVAPFRLAQAVFPHMRAAGGGAIVHISSISGRVGIPGIPQASYAASKAGLSGLTAELAVQWARQPIRVNTVAPGFFRSEITEGMYDDERQVAWLRRNTPLPYDGHGRRRGGRRALAGQRGRAVRDRPDRRRRRRVDGAADHTVIASSRRRGMG